MVDPERMQLYVQSLVLQARLHHLMRDNVVSAISIVFPLSHNPDHRIVRERWPLVALASLHDQVWPATATMAL